MHIELGMAKDTSQNGFSFEQQKKITPLQSLFILEMQNDVLAHWSR